MKKKNFLVGLEREALRLTKDGKIDLSSHPYSFGDKLFNPYITTDFSESQLEIITPAFSSNKEALNSLHEIVNFLHFQEPLLNLHKHSLPPDGNAYIARFGPKGREKEGYREYLLEKYGLNMQLISGLHYNFSIEGLGCLDYLHILRNVVRYGFILPALFGHSKTKEFPHATSLRGSSKGYFPKEQQTLNIDFNSIEGYLSSIKKSGLYGKEEYYLFIRPKCRNCEIPYIELRALDLDPNTPLGITLETMDFVKDFLFKMYEIPSPKLSFEELHQHLTLYEKICIEGQKHQSLIDETLIKLDLERPIQIYNTKISPQNYDYLERAVKRSHIDSLELSTRLLIKEAQKQKIDVDIVDKETSTIKLSQNGKNSILSQATFTEKDSFISYRIQQNKDLTKRLLQNEGLSTTEGSLYTKEMIDLQAFLGKHICIKPNLANYGDGISILKTENPIALQEAFDVAFKECAQVLVEDYFKGEEFRFFVIDGKEVFVCRRTPPYIVGDGKSTIKELIQQQNKRRPKEFPIKAPMKDNEVIKKGLKINLRENSNVSTGGFAEDVTDIIHESFKEIAVKAAQTLGGFLCGVDILIQKPFEDATFQTYAILETNYNPALYLHEHPLFGGRAVSKSILCALGFDCALC